MSNVTKCPLTKLKLSTAKKEEEVFHSFFQQSNNKTKQFFLKQRENTLALARHIQKLYRFIDILFNKKKEKRDFLRRQK